MAYLQESYEDNRFVNPVPDNLRCVICMNILVDAMQCVDNEHSFCKSCITRYLQEKLRCPTCIEPLTLQTLRPSRLVREMVSQLMMHCDNAARGCPEKVKVETLLHHVANCDFQPVNCSNNGCEVVTSKIDQLHHERNECNFRLAECRVCGEQVSYWQRKVHCYVTRKEMDKMKVSLRETKNEMLEIKQTVNNLSIQLMCFMEEFKGDIAGIKGHIVGIKDDMGRMGGVILGVKGKIAGIKNDVGSMEGKIAGIKNDVGRMGGEIAGMKDDVVGIECELGVQWKDSGEIYNDIVIIGGTGVNISNHSHSVEIFSHNTMSWTFLSSTTSSRWFSSSFVYQDQIVVHGGMKSDDMETLQFSIHDHSWKKLKGSRLPQQMLGHASIVYQDYLFIFGGANDGVKKFEGIYKTDLVPPYAFTLVCCMPEPRSQHGAHLFGDKVVIVGGSQTTINYCLDTVLEYNISENTCRYLSRLPYPVCEMATVAWEDNIIVIGGEDNDDEALDKVVMYNIINGKSTILPAMKEKRSRCFAVMAGRNVIVVMGGWNSEKGNLDSVESFSFDLQCWESLPPMNVSRQAATAVLIPG